MPPRQRLRIPTELRTILLGGVATLACSSTSSTLPPLDGGSRADTGADASARDARVAAFDGGPCTIKVPKGTVCETTCYNVGTNPISPYACQVYCNPPDGGPGHCSCNGGVSLEGGIGICPGGLDCELEAYPDGGTQVLC